MPRTLYLPTWVENRSLKRTATRYTVVARGLLMWRSHTNLRGRGAQSVLLGNLIEFAYAKRGAPDLLHSTGWLYMEVAVRE